MRLYIYSTEQERHHATLFNDLKSRQHVGTLHVNQQDSAKYNTLLRNTLRGGDNWVICFSQGKDKFTYQDCTFLTVLTAKSQENWLRGSDLMTMQTQHQWFVITPTQFNKFQGQLKEFQVNDLQHYFPHAPSASGRRKTALFNEHRDATSARPHAALTRSSAQGHTAATATTSASAPLLDDVTKKSCCNLL